MNFNQPAYPLSAPLLVEVHKLLSDLPAKQSRNILNAIDAEIAAHQQKCDEEEKKIKQALEEVNKKMKEQDAVELPEASNAPS